MPLPTVEDLTPKFREYIGGAAAGGNAFIESSVETAMAYIGTKIPATDGLQIVDGFLVGNAATIPMPEPNYVEEVMELASDLFYRRQAQNGVVSVNAMDGIAIRVARDPYAACDQRLQRWIGLGFA